MAACLLDAGQPTLAIAVELKKTHFGREVKRPQDIKTSPVASIQHFHTQISWSSENQKEMKDIFQEE